MFGSLKTKLMLLVSALLFLAICVVGAFIYFDNLKRIETSLGERAVGIARTAATAINGDDHHAISMNIGGAGEMAELETMRKKLREIKATNNLQTDVYTYVKAWWVENSTDIVFVASSNTNPFEIKGQKMEAYMNKALTESQSGFTAIFTTINGEWITGYAPIKTKDGEVSGVVEVALETSREVAAAKKAFFVSVAIAAGIALLTGTILTFFVSVGIARPIVSLTDTTKSMADGNLKARATVNGRDEVAKLGNYFNNMAENLERSYKELENYSKNLEKMVEERTAEVVAGKKKIQKILNHIEQGILTFDQSLTIDTEFSAFLARFYGVEPNAIAGKNVVDFILPGTSLSADELNQANETLKSVVGENSIAWDFNSEHLPSEAAILIGNQRKIIALEWTPMVNDQDTTERLMLAMRDLTTQRELEAKMAAQKAANEKLMTMISEIVAQKRSSIGKYLDDAKSRVTAVESELAGSYNAATMFRELHTIKGGARLIKAKSLMNVAHLAEEPCQDLLKGENVNKNEFTASIVDLKRELDEYRHVFHNVLGGGGDSAAASDNESLTSMVGAQVATLKKAIEHNGCFFSSIKCHDGVTSWKKDVVADLGNIIMHGLNNSVDHGYLRPKSRGKPVTAVDLEVEARLEGDQVTVEIRDLGDGFNLEKIKDLAKQKGLTFTDNENGILDVLFADGLSTAESVSESSGRGVGLAAVKAMAAKLGGTVKLRRNQPRGATLQLSFPVGMVAETTTRDATLRPLAS